MCGIMQSGFCRFGELTTGQFALTKQLILRVALPHVTLLIVSLLYAVIGSWVITVLKFTQEDPSGDYEALQRLKRHYVSSLVRGRGDEDFEIFAQRSHELYKRLPLLTDAWSQEFAQKNASYAWIRRFRWNLLFSATTLTSIGYGNDSPASTFGRLFCVVFLMFGIPLYLITLADAAKFCTEFMNRAYMEYMKKFIAVKRRFYRWRQGKLRRDSIVINNVIIAGGDEEVAEFLWTHLEKTHFVEIPFVLVYAILIIYIGFASWMVAQIEGWTFVDGVYFIIMSVLTIGFGDLVPINESWTLLVLILILVGLVLTTTCVDIVGAYYIDRLHFFGRRLDKEDPLAWLKAVQRRRIMMMKREAMRKLFETVTALNHIRLETVQKLAMAAKEAQQVHEPPLPPRDLIAFNATADSVTLRWASPIKLEEGRRYWYTLTYKPRTPQRRTNVEMVDFINAETYVVTGLKSFILYEFSLRTTTRYGHSMPARCQEYTEPCTVPTLLRVEAISTESATISWRAPIKNNGPEEYIVQYSQEPAPQFRYWDRFKCGTSKKFTIPNLSPGTRYIVCVTAVHNFGLAAMSKSTRFTTKSWWGEESELHPLPFIQRSLSAISNVSSLR
ncbi:unnamed protein product, partial [Mesorhabditis belari]|uniref:Fibronectin type-III domain-containing protein n=1 Tax=Mesorhabditis belari TaxID=2138241 RepID=A0AAF3EIP0_9BILA